MKVTVKGELNIDSLLKRLEEEEAKSKEKIETGDRIDRIIEKKTEELREQGYYNESEIDDIKYKLVIEDMVSEFANKMIQKGRESI